METASGSVLSIDTSGETCSVALQGVDGAIYEACSAGAGDHFETMSLLVGRCVQQSGAALDSVTNLRVGVGPGSFTGLRIGMSFCKGLAWARRLSLAGFCSFEAIAQVALRSGVSGTIAVASDARRDEVFCAGYELDSAAQSVVCKQEPQIVSLAQFIVSYVDCPGKVALFTPMKSLQVAGKDLESVAQIATGGLFSSISAGSRGVSEIATIEPNYLRAVAAKTIAERSIGA